MLVADPVALSVLHEAFWRREGAQVALHSARPSARAPVREASRRPAIVTPGRPAAAPLRHTGA
jgi:hypothetical protein